MEIKEYGIVYGIDEVRKRRALRIYEKVAPYADALKVEIIQDYSFIRRVKNLGLPVVVDAKLAHHAFLNPINLQFEGTTSKRIYLLANAGADYIIVHMFLGPLVIQEAVDAAHKYGVKLLGLVRMTHRGAKLSYEHPLNKKFMRKELKGSGFLELLSKLENCKTFSDFFLMEGEHFGFDGYIAPAFDLEYLLKLRTTGKKIFGTGVGRQWPNRELLLNEQMKEMFSICRSNSAAIFATEVYKTKDPREKAHQIMLWRDEIVKELDKIELPTRQL